MKRSSIWLNDDHLVVEAEVSILKLSNEFRERRMIDLGKTRGEGLVRSLASLYSSVCTVNQTKHEV
jgi:hypothetical protein